MNYLESVVNRIPDSVIEALDDASLEYCIGSGEHLFVNFVDSNGLFTGSAFDIMLDGVNYYAWTSPNCCFGAERLIAIGELVDAMNNIAHKDFMESLSEKDGL